MGEEETKHDCLTAALVAAQAEFPPLERSSEVNIKTKSGASFNYKYASLDTLRGQTDNSLHKNGLVVNHRTRIEGDRVILVSQLAHAESKENLTAEWPVGSVDDDPKDLGANMTYGMRYTYSALTGRVAEDDSDAQRTKAPKKPELKKQQPEPTQQVPEDFGDFPDNQSEQPSPEKQKDNLTLARESCMARVTELNIDDAWCKEWLVAQYELKESRNEMTEVQWRDARAKLDARVTKSDGMLEGQVITLDKHLTELGYTGTDDPNLLAAMKKIKSLAHLTVGDVKQIDPEAGANMINLMWLKVKANRAKEKASG